MNRDQRITKPVQFSFGLAFRWLDHDGAWDRPGNSRGMEAEIHQAFGDILHRDRFEGAKVKDALMGDEVAMAAVKDGEATFQAFGDVVSVEDGVLSGLPQTGGAHRCNVYPRDGQDTGAAPGRCRNG